MIGGHIRKVCGEINNFEATCHVAYMQAKHRTNNTTDVASNLRRVGKKIEETKGAHKRGDDGDFTEVELQLSNQLVDIMIVAREAKLDLGAAVAAQLEKFYEA